MTGRRRTTREMQHDPDFAQIAEQHLREVYGYLAYLTGDRQLAEELTSAAFEKALRSWSRYDPRRASANTWLCTIARSVALDHFRSEDPRRLPWRWFRASPASARRRLLRRCPGAGGGPSSCSSRPACSCWPASAQACCSEAARHGAASRQARPASSSVGPCNGSEGRVLP